jgi:hypothetical protein
VSRRPWIAREDRALRKLYPHMRTDDAARILGRSLAATYGRAQLLGIEKSAAYNASALSGRMVPGFAPYGEKSRFKKGAVAWNKGKTYRPGGRCAETQFRKGALPHNTLPVGSYRLEPGTGTLQRKIGNAKGSNSKRWRGVHELVWTAQNGPVPPKHICVFKPGMRTTLLKEITIDRVECISLAENMRRNTLHRYPQPIPQLIQLRGALQRQINKRAP